MELEIKVMWCKGLTAFNFFQKLTVYTSVSIASLDKTIKLNEDKKQTQRTPVDEKNEGDPEWNHPMKFDLRRLRVINTFLYDLCLVFELRCRGQIFGDKTIGEVKVPLNELIQSVSCGVARFVKYEVRNSEGKHNGVLDFSYRLIDNVDNLHHHVQITGYHHHHHHYHHYHDHDHHQSHEQHYTNSHDHVIGHTHTELDESFSETNSDIVQYPKIDLDEPLAPPMVYPPPSSSSLSSSSSSYYASSLSFTSTNSAHYNPVYPPPSSQTLAPTHVPSFHYPPPPQEQPYVYPPPPLQQQPRPFGDPHWGYQRADSYPHW